MSCRIALHLQPTSLDCVRWSKDNLIAVGGGEQIAVLAPRLNEPGLNGTHWDAAIFNANEFTAEEIAPLDPLSFRNFSPGEELSLRHVQALDWSSPGLSKFGRCVLAVLNTNHVLSLWGCDGRASVDANWKRMVILNPVIDAHYSRLGQDREEPDQDQVERARIRQRVRSFAWSPLIHTRDGSSSTRATFSSSSGSKHQFMAISTEARDIMILSVRSPYDILAPGLEDFDIEVVGSSEIRHEQFADATEGFVCKDSNRPSLNGKVHVAESIAWSDWVQLHAERYTSNLAYATTCGLFYLKLTLDISGNSPQLNIKDQHHKTLLSSPKSHVHGPLKFVPFTNSLIAFSAGKAFCLDLAGTSNDPNAASSHHMDDRWDEISGVAFTQSSKDLSQVCITSHLSTATAKTASLSLPLLKETTLVQPGWQQAIIETKATFSAQHDLDGQVAERVWGIASSPLGEYVVTAASMLPSDCVTYTIASEQKIVLNITNVFSDDETWILRDEFSAKIPADTAMETILFSIKRLADQRNPQHDLEEALNAVMSSIYVSDSDKTDLDDSHRNPALRVRHLRQNVFMHPDIRTKRAKFLADVVHKRATDPKQIFRPVLERLVDVALGLPKDLITGGKISARLHARYTTIKSKLEPDINADRTGAEVQDLAEECLICQKAIPFQSLLRATCENGHQFSRCALTFFAIQEPGVSKHCAVCGTQLLNEWLLSGSNNARSDHEEVNVTELSGGPGNNLTERADTQQHQHENFPSNSTLADQADKADGWVHLSLADSKEPESSLARIIFAAFETCVYCGGKFIT